MKISSLPENQSNAATAAENAEPLPVPRKDAPQPQQRSAGAAAEEENIIEPSGFTNQEANNALLHELSTNDA